MVSFQLSLRCFVRVQIYLGETERMVTPVIFVLWYVLFLALSFCFAQFQSPFGGTCTTKVVGRCHSGGKAGAWPHWWSSGCGARSGWSTACRRRTCPAAARRLPRRAAAPRPRLPAAAHRHPGPGGTTGTAAAAPTGTTGGTTIGTVAVAAAVGTAAAGGAGAGSGMAEVAARSRLRGTGQWLRNVPEKRRDRPCPGVGTSIIVHLMSQLREVLLDSHWTCSL